MSFFTLMHLSFHYAIGVIFASIYSLIFPTEGWQFGLITIFSVIPDFDIIYLMFTKEKNHRMFFTHSVYFSLIFLVLGVILMKWWLIFCGIGALVHVFIDLMDWGTNFLFTKRLFGPRLLLAKDEWDKVPELMAKEFDPKWFFVLRYFKSIFFQTFEIIAGVSVIILFIFIVPEYWYFIFGYILTLGYHLFEYFELRYRSIHQKTRFSLIKH